MLNRRWCCVNGLVADLVLTAFCVALQPVFCADSDCLQTHLVLDNFTGLLHQNLHKMKISPPKAVISIIEIIPKKIIRKFSGYASFRVIAKAREELR